MTRKKSIINFSRLLRKEQTKAEKMLWEKLRNIKLEGFKIRRQHPIKKSFVVDFYCAEKKLIIEVDGKVHEEDNVKEKDKKREEFLYNWKYKILRITNEEVYDDIDAVLKKILKALKE